MDITTEDILTNLQNKVYPRDYVPDFVTMLYKRGYKLCFDYVECKLFLIPLNKTYDGFEYPNNGDDRGTERKIN